jgi:hypothetical protein
MKCAYHGKRFIQLPGGGQKRLMTITRDPSRTEKLEECDRVLAECLERGAVEKVSEKKNKNCG